jgi:hypothetical protein
MIATALNRLNWQRLRLTKSAGLRGLAAGTTWGVLVAAGLIATAFWDCGAIAVEDATITAAASIGGGILAIGPLAAYSGRR